MSLIVAVEDGTGQEDANSYVSVADADSYFTGHVYPAAWVLPANASLKGAALVMATRLIDSNCRFDGFRKSNLQALQWPRVRCIDREANGVVGLPCLAFGLGAMSPQYLASDSVPQCVVSATCEMAIELLRRDPTLDPVGFGLKSSAVSGSAFVYDKTDRRPVLPQVVVALLSRVLISAPGMAGVRLVRV